MEYRALLMECRALLTCVYAQVSMEQIVVTLFRRV